MAKGNPFEVKHPLKTEWILGIVGGVLTLAALGLGRAYGKISHSSINEKLIVWFAALGLVVAGTYAIVHLSRAVGRSIARRTSIGTGASVRLVTNGVGYIILIFALLTVLGVSLDHLLIGAGVAGIILGVAAQQSLGNIFAAIVMLVARPFVVGDMIRIRSGVTGVLDVRVLGIGLTYVTVDTDDGLLRVPNSLLLAAGIGQLRPGAPLTPSQKPTPPPDTATSAPPQSTPQPEFPTVPVDQATSGDTSQSGVSQPSHPPSRVAGETQPFSESRHSQDESPQT